MKINIEDILVILIGVFLTQSSVIFNVNFSLADFFLFLLIFLWIINGKKFINNKILFFSLLLLSYLLFLNLIVTPLIWGEYASIKTILVESIKLLILFLYLNLGYYLLVINKIEKVFYSFLISSTIISIIGIIQSIFHLKIFSFMLYGDIRLKGFMNDPNLFGVMEMIALVLAYTLLKNQMLKFISIIIIVTSILLTGSKTTFICLLIVGLVFLIREFLKFNFKNMIYAGIIFIIMLIPFVIYNEVFFSLISNSSVFRVTSIFSDSDNAFTSSGSSRNEAWTTSLKIILNSCLFGVGLGNYLIISNKYYTVGVLAHNTYLQLLAEWGVLITCLIVSIILSKTVSLYVYGKKYRFLTAIIAIFFISSLAISLNNMRMMWFIIGIVVFFEKKKNFLG